MISAETETGRELARIAEDPESFAEALKWWASLQRFNPVKRTNEVSHMESQRGEPHGKPNRKENPNMVERKSGRTLDHLGHLLDTGNYHVVLVDGAKVRVEEGEVVSLEEIENAEYEVADVQRAADLVKQHPELRLVVLLDPHCGATVPYFPRRSDRESPELPELF